MLVLPKRVLAAAILGTSSTGTSSLLFVRSLPIHRIEKGFHGRHLTVFAQSQIHSLVNPAASFLYPPAAVSRTRRTMSTAKHQDDSVEVAAAVSAPIAANLQHVRDRIRSTCERCGVPKDKVRLVAVSKTKPVSLLQQAYDVGHREFGENYVQELVDKVPQLPEDVNWHFIGPLQSNKANKLVQTFDAHQLHRLVIETVASEKLASKLNHAVATAIGAAAPSSPEGASTTQSSPRTLRVMVQVNTSGEESKSGVARVDAVALCRFIVEQCPNLRLSGVMTIGAEGDPSCFDALVECRDRVAEELGLPELEVSMGMSGDFEEAIERGATSVRVGSTIFGERDYSK